MTTLSWMLFFVAYLSFILLLMAGVNSWKGSFRTSSTDFCLFLKMLFASPNTRLVFERSVNQTCPFSYRLSEAVEMVP